MPIWAIGSVNGVRSIYASNYTRYPALFKKVKFGSAFLFFWIIERNPFWTKECFHNYHSFLWRAMKMLVALVRDWNHLLYLAGSRLQRKIAKRQPILKCWELQIVAFVASVLVPGILIIHWKLPLKVERSVWNWKE